jgi:hypothetical protein
MKKLLTLLILLSSLSVFSQIKFQNGYIIINNQKKECLIQNDEWINTPKNIKFKLSDSSPIININVDSIQELRVYNTSQYFIRAQVNLTPFDKQANVESVFFKFLLAGKASLFSHRDKDEELFFFSIDTSDIMLLKYSKYVEDGIIREDIMFKRQLLIYLKCNSINEDKLVKTNYAKGPLLNIFKLYNLCQNSESETFDNVKAKGEFHLSAICGMSLFGIQNNAISNGEGVNSNSKNSLKLGLDVEYRFPFNRNKWSLFSELTYSRYATNGSYLKYTWSEAPSSPGRGQESFSFYSKYSVLELPVGFRYYSFINSKNCIFYNAAISYHLIVPIDNSLYFNTTPDDLLLQNSELTGGFGLNLGIGYKYNTKFGIEIRYSKIEMMIIRGFNANIKTVSFLISYKI